MSIIHAFLHWVLGVLMPGSGRRRAGMRPAGPVFTRTPEASRTATVWPPVARSPYGLHAPLDGRAAALVRPYVLDAQWERERQARRRVALVLAADFGIDLDRHVVGAEAVAR